MGEYGIRIRNIQVGSIYAVMCGVRENYDYTPAMLTNSLFTDFLREQRGFHEHNGATRDIVCACFDYGSRSYEQEKERITKKIAEIEDELRKNTTDEKNQIETSIYSFDSDIGLCDRDELQRKKKSQENDDVADESEMDDNHADDVVPLTTEQLTVLQKKLEYYQGLLERCEENRDKFDKKSAREIRKLFYENGFDIVYKNKNGGVQTVHYKMLYRTPGKAKKGTCMFIRDRLYPKARNFLYMGIKLPKHNAPIVEIGAYSSLVTSTIIDRIEIDPKNILIVKDVESAFKTTAISIETDAEKHCKAVRKRDYKVKNVMFDGQALIDLSIFPDYGNGYILLRQHFTKMAAFATDIQKFFRDYFKDEYETAKVMDMFGNEHNVRDIQLITTDKAVKWTKFKVSYDRWCEWVNKNGNRFGVVKTAHKSKLGDVQRMSYQMVNALDANTMDRVMSKTVEYVTALKTDIDVYIDFLRRGASFTNDYEVLVALYEQDHTFEQSKYFRERRWKIIQQYTRDIKNGKIIQNGDNLVIVGSPYAMLLHAVGESVENDSTFSVEDNAIQCYTERFVNGAYLAGFRSPFNSQNNLCYLHNHRHDIFDKYFQFGDCVIAVNLRHTDFQARANGSDQDSDSLYTTDQAEIVTHAARCYKLYPTIVNNIPQETKHYDRTMQNFAIIDNRLAAAQRAIGESSNLAQVCLTYTYNFPSAKYVDNVCILATIAQAAIDSAKRSFDINIPAEIRRIKKDSMVKENKYPKFWLKIRDGFDRDNINYTLSCPMNKLYDIEFGKYPTDASTLPDSDFFVQHDLDMDLKISRRIEKLITKYSLGIRNYYKEDCEDQQRYFIIRDDFDRMIEEIRNEKLANKYIGLMSWLINRAFAMTDSYRRKVGVSKSRLNKNKAILLRTLYEVNPKMLLRCFAGNICG